MKKTLKAKGIRWPKRRTPAEMRRMSTRALLGYAMRLHMAWADQHKRDMEWDLFWTEFYKRLLQSSRGKR
jgi:hypothetical protein